MRKFTLIFTHRHGTNLYFFEADEIPENSVLIEAFEIDFDENRLDEELEVVEIQEFKKICS